MRDGTVVSAPAARRGADHAPALRVRKAGACHPDAECTQGAACVTGVGQMTGGAAAGGGSKGSAIPGEGRRCIPPDGSKLSSWAEEKSGRTLGACPQGTHCNNTGICVRLET